MKHFVIPPAMGKRLIGKGLAQRLAAGSVLNKGTLVIIAGTTNGYVAEEVLAATGQAKGFSRKGFRRGMVVPIGFDAGSVKADFTGDVVLVDGVWQRGKTIFDVADGLTAGDVILKGANAVDLRHRRAAILIGDPQAGTAGAAIRADYGRRARMIVPVGLEKRGCCPCRARFVPSWMPSSNSPGPRPGWSPPAASTGPRGRSGSW